MMRSDLAAAKRCCLVAIAWCTVGAWATAAPQIGNVSLRGLQAGGVTTLVIDGSELLPEPRVVFSAPLIKATIKEGATPTRLEIEFALDGQTPAGIYLLRLASASGISPPVALAVDNLPQMAFVPQLATQNVALSGALSGSTVLTTSFTGKQGQRVAIDVESRRLGGRLDPVVHLYDARHTQIAWSPGLPQLEGDARCTATLPADGIYSIELHDALFRGDNPGFFRMKVGDFYYADVVYPLAARQGVNATFEFGSTNLPAETRASAVFALIDYLPRQVQPAPWPAGVPAISGARPRVIVTDQSEVLEAPPSDKPQEVVAAPLGINGRVAQPGEQDRYRLAVTPGQTLRFDVLARRAGSPLDGVLSIRNEQGAELAGNDDRPNTKDPGLDFKVPDGVQAVVIVLSDLLGRGGSEYVYRIAVEPLGSPDYSLVLTDERYQVPKDGATLVRVRTDRAGYNGPIKLSFPNLPPSVSITGDEIPAGATQALVTLSAPGLPPAHSLTTIVGASTEPNTSIRRAALVPEDAVNRGQPWLRRDVAVAVTTPAALAISWDLYSADTKLALGAVLPVKVRVVRAEGVQGAVRLALVTTQVTPRKTEKVNNQDRQVDDIERTLRFQSAPMIAADQSEVPANVLVPADLPAIAYDLAIEAELLAGDNKTVVAKVVTPARRLVTALPISIELASKDPIEARAGVGPTGKLVGKITRAAGFALPVNLTLTGLPKGTSAPSLTVLGDKSDFEFPISLPYGTAAGEMKGVKLLAMSLTDPKNPKSILRMPELPIALTVVPGEKPPVEAPLAIFEDQSEFVELLKEGGGQASLASDEKYSGSFSIKVTPDQRFNPALPSLGVKIRENPGPGEFRYLRFAWKKQGGQAICLQLNHDGQWGPAADKPGKFRYHAGPSGELFGGSVGVDANLPAALTVVTRDLFADFGEFTLSGIALTPVDGEYALFDHIYLSAAPEAFELVKP